MRRAARRDASEGPIVRALEAAGVSVWRLDRPVDLLAGFRGVTHLLEAKTPGTSYGKRLNANQQNFADGWKGAPVHRVSTPEEALRAVGAMKDET